MPENLINFLTGLPCQLVLIYAATRLLDIPRKGWYWLVSLLVVLPFLVAQDVLRQPARMLLGTVGMMVPWLVFARDPLPRRLFVSVLIMLVVVIAEIPPTFLWSHVIGSDLAVKPAAGVNLDFFIASHLLHLVVLMGLLVVLEAVERWLRSTSTRNGIAQFIGFIVVQYLLIAFSVGIMEVTGDVSRPIVLGNLIVAAACVVADAFFFPLMERYNLKVREDERARVLALELSHYLARYREVEREVSAVARVRHDLRNQANVALMLIAQGAVDKAHAFVCELLGRVVEIVGLEGEAAADVEGVLAVEARGAEDAGAGTAARRADGDADDGPAASALDDVSWRRKPARPTAAVLRTPRRRALISLVFPLSQLAVLSFLVWYAVAYQPPLWVLVAVGVVAALCIVADVMLFRALSAIDESELAAERVRLLEEQRELQRVYYERLRSGLEEARGMREDIVAVLCDLERLLAEGRADEAAERIRRAADNMDSADAYCCENRAVGALMAMKLRACADADIPVDCQIVVPEDLAILDVDLCAVFSNLMDNAIRSCRVVEGPCRRITIKACLVSGVLMVDLLNGRVAEGEGDASAEELRPRVAFADRELPVASHGWGLQILRSLACRYGGSLKAEAEGDCWFRTTVMIINERPAKNPPGGGRSAKVPLARASAPRRRAEDSAGRDGHRA